MMDLDFWDCFGRKKLSYNQRNTVVGEHVTLSNFLIKILLIYMLVKNMFEQTFKSHYDTGQIFSIYCYSNKMFDSIFMSYFQMFSIKLMMCIRIPNKCGNMLKIL